MENKEERQKREAEEKKNYLALAKEGYKLEQNQVKKVIVRIARFLMNLNDTICRKTTLTSQSG